MPIDLTKRLSKPETDVGELECFLVSEFSDASQTEPDRVVHGGQLAVEYNKKKKIKKIEWLNDSSNNLAEKLVQNAEAALYGDLGLSVGQRCIFAPNSIQGVLRVGDDFQVAPLPDQAPRPEFSMAKHPGLLEFSYRKSSHVGVDMFRRQAREQELMLLLGVVLGSRITSESKFGRHEWVHTKSDDALTSDYLQVGYIPGDLWTSKDAVGFSVDQDWECVESISSEDYYDANGYSRTTGSDPFAIPDTFEQSCRMYSALSKDDRARFLRSAKWYKTSSDVFYSSRSLAYSVLVFALESLMPPAEEGDECETCGIRKRESIGKRFATFLETYCRGVPAELVREFASMRSRYVHGDSLMLSDAEVTAFRFSAPINDEGSKHRVLSYVCHITLLGWLHRRDESTG